MIKAQTRQDGARVLDADGSPAQSLHRHRQRRRRRSSRCKALEQAGGAAGRAQLYFKLGKLLERELENVRAKKNTKALADLTARTRHS